MSSQHSPASPPPAPASPENAPGGPSARLHAAAVAELVATQAFPSISILLSTTPASSMTPRDAARLQQLVRQTAALLHDRRVLNAREFLITLNALADSAISQPTSQALALFVNRAVQRTLRLPIPVRSRVVIEDTFATRDLIHALHRTPPHLTLLLQPYSAQLYEGTGDNLTPIHTLATLNVGPSQPPDIIGATVTDHEAKDPGLAEVGFPLQRRLEVPVPARDGDRFLQRVDQALGRYRQRHPAPLIVAGHQRTVERFLVLSRNRNRLAGTITGPDSESPATLHHATRTAIQSYLLSRQDEALEHLEHTRTTARLVPGPQGPTVVTGAAACWAAAHNASPMMLAVEETYVQPARITPTQPGLPVAPQRVELLATDPSGATGPAGGRSSDPSTLRSDLIDDLIEVVIARGGWVALVDDGRLRHLDRVALTMQPGTTGDHVGPVPAGLLHIPPRGAR
ncbi:hypothetical protein [Kribbella sp. NBC_00889]|uniref:baeRF3 domain-containing protein n=1 Tax=Kribbella sp. NBC_00889 TaxID=2975974 RepID=UPI003866FC56|nr:hypothetical protein OG817_24390 [Kribbella sp. NBC_00889]